jgi:hypothetical protein
MASVKWRCFSQRLKRLKINSERHRFELLAGMGHFGKRRMPRKEQVMRVDGGWREEEDGKL